MKRKYFLSKDTLGNCLFGVGNESDDKAYAGGFLLKFMSDKTVRLWHVMSRFKLETHPSRQHILPEYKFTLKDLEWKNFRLCIKGFKLSAIIYFTDTICGTCSSVNKEIGLDLNSIGKLIEEEI